jgi:hypothetical protein
VWRDQPDLMEALIALWNKDKSTHRGFFNLRRRLRSDDTPVEEERRVLEHFRSGGGGVSERRRSCVFKLWPLFYTTPLRQRADFFALDADQRVGGGGCF